jgi:chemotaxis signal transduction protein
MSGFKRNFKAVRKDAAKFVRGRIEKRTRSAGSRVSEVAKLLRSSVRDVQSPESPFADHAVESIAQRLDAAGRYLSVSDTDRLLADVESLARRVPLTFTISGFLLGFATGRFLRASRDA